MAENDGAINRLTTRLVEANKNAAEEIKTSIKDTFSPFADQITAPLKQMKAGVESLPGVGFTKKVFAGLTKPLEASAAADNKGASAEAEQENKDTRDKEKNLTLMVDIRDGIFGVQKGLMEGLAGLKDKGLLGLGILAGLVAAPFVALTAFFTQLGMEVKMLDKFLKGGLSRLFRPIIRFFDAIGDIFGKAGTGRFLKGDTIKIFGKYADDIALFIGRIKKVFQPIINGVSKVAGFVKTSETFMKGFQPVIKFAQGAGKLLGKIFLPITIVMTLIDVVKGMFAGYEDDGWLGAIEGGLTGLINSIIGMPLDLLKKAVSWMLGMFGFDNASAALDSFSFSDLISDAIGGIFDFGKKAFEWFGQLFTDPVGALQDLWTGLVGEGGFIDLITTPYNMAVNWLLGLFGWSDPENPFNFLETVTGAFSSAVAWVKDLFSWPEDGDVGTAVTKFIDIILAPYNLAVNWLMGLFGWETPDGEPFSIGKLVMDAVDNIISWFKGLLDIDVGAIVDSIPGASTVLKALGIMDESPQEKQRNVEAAIKEAQDRISRSEGGENVYFGRESKGREEDAAELAQLQSELDALKMEQGNVVVNNYNNTDNSTNSSSSTVTTQPLKDTAAPAGTVAAM